MPVAGYRIAAFSYVAELVKSFDSPSFSKVLTTSATKLAIKFEEEPSYDRLSSVHFQIADVSVFGRLMTDAQSVFHCDGAVTLRCGDQRIRLAFGQLLWQRKPSIAARFD